MDHVLTEHVRYTRRYFMALGAGASAAVAVGGCDHSGSTTVVPNPKGDYLTAQQMFGTVERGDPLPYKLPPAELAAARLTEDTWRLEVIADPDDPAELDHGLSLEDGTAFAFAQLQRHARQHSVRFLKTMTCANGAKPLGTGLWEGIPLRDVIGLTGVRKKFRRLWYFGFHNNDPKQRFQSSLSADRLFEDPPGTPPVILAYRLNGKPISGKRGGPVRLVVPEAYGFKNVKWLRRIMLSNRSTSNDTYAKYNNTTESWMKTLARFANKSARAVQGHGIPLSGIAQVGTAGLVEVQVLLKQGDVKADADHFLDDRDWQTAELLAPPTDDWGASLPRSHHPGGRRGVEPAFGFSAKTRAPQSWPMRFTSCHWAIVATPKRAGRYTAFCRTIDRNSDPQPWPRTLQNSGRNLLHRIPIHIG